VEGGREGETLDPVDKTSTSLAEITLRLWDQGCTAACTAAHHCPCIASRTLLKQLATTLLLCACHADAPPIPGVDWPRSAATGTSAAAPGSSPGRSTNKAGSSGAVSASLRPYASPLSLLHSARGTHLVFSF